MQGFGRISVVMRRRYTLEELGVFSSAKEGGGMRFRDIRRFNLAMLAKQGWKMLTDQGSLLYRCFKAKYFPQCIFLEVVDNPHSSYVWKS